MAPSTTPHPNTLTGSRVLVIGGTSGIGYAIASGALANGAKVYLSSSNPSKISDTIAHLKSLYPNAIVSGKAADLSNRDTVEANLKAVLDGAVQEFGGPLDHIAYTAGDAFKPKALADFAASTAFDQWVVRFLGPSMVAKLVSTHPDTYLAKKASSSITLTSGVLSKKPAPGMSVMIPLTGGVEVLSRALAVELAPIRTNVVQPGAIQTELLDKFGEEAKAMWREKTLVKAIGTPEEAAETYLYSMRCGYVTGQDLLVDGGLVYA